MVEPRFCFLQNKHDMWYNIVIIHLPRPCIFVCVLSRVTWLYARIWSRLLYGHVSWQRFDSLAWCWNVLPNISLSVLGFAFITADTISSMQYIQDNIYIHTDSFCLSPIRHHPRPVSLLYCSLSTSTGSRTSCTQQQPHFVVNHSKDTKLSNWIVSSIRRFVMS